MTFPSGMFIFPIVIGYVVELFIVQDIINESQIETISFYPYMKDR